MRVLILRVVLLVAAAVGGVALGARHVTVAPDLVVVVLVAIGVVDGARTASLWGLVGGWLVDLVPPGAAVLGVGALLYAAAGAVSGRGHRVDRVTIPWAVVVAAASAGTLALLRILVLAWQGLPVDLVPRVGTVTLTAATAGLVVPILRRTEDRLSGRRR